MDHYSDSYGTPEAQGIQKSLLEGEINIVENIKNYEKNKSNIIEKADSEIRMCDLTAAQESQREEIKKAIIDVEEAEY